MSGRLDNDATTRMRQVGLMASLSISSFTS